MRPDLTGQLSAQDFRDYYWLKEELLAFCRAQGLSTLGSKAALSARIARFLETGQRRAEEAPTAGQRPAPAAGMPLSFTRDSVIGKGWRCSQALRAFLEREIGPGFHFDGVMRDFIHQQAGRTLGEAIAAWEAARQVPQKKDIPPQFEYNRHMRAYFEQHPGATRAEALEAWKQSRQTRRG